jgi:hypothetical protein
MDYFVAELGRGLCAMMPVGLYELGRGAWYEAIYQANFRAWSPVTFSRSAQVALLWHVATKGEIRMSKESLYELIERIAAKHGTTYAVLKSNCRSRPVVIARHEAMRAVKEMRPNMSSPELGRLFNKDHTTALYALGALTARTPSYYARCGGNMQNLKNQKGAGNGEVCGNSEPDAGGIEGLSAHGEQRG